MQIDPEKPRSTLNLEAYELAKELYPFHKRNLYCSEAQRSKPA